MIPSTIDRVPQQTAAHVNEQIRRQTDANIARALTTGPTAIRQRLAELEREWDIERLLETNASSAILASCALGAFVDKRFFAIPAVIAAFLLQHAIQGWCPPLPVMRRLGVRTSEEINREREALKRALGEDSATRRAS
ncbi:MAG: hypothetical protein C0485_06165 [Pirellula sp.]|nr:hypothetical protein [Pirellula sp.]